jgi:hypothetical protein
MRRGKIDISQLKTLPERHELETADYLANLGYDIEFIAPRNSPNVHTPDIFMDGVSWEIKCPKGKSKRTIENNFRKAKQQAENIIFDLRRINIPEEKCMLELKRRFAQKRDVKRLLIIKKSGEILKFLR